jgi:phosphoribosylformylglycinamidine synthase
MLPGAMLRNRGLKFICKSTDLLVEDSVCQWLDTPAGKQISVPINHNEGNYYCDAETLERLNAGRQVVLRYVEADGSRAFGGSAPNGSLDDIAGICNERGNVFGLMPHPERVVEPITGGTDGQPFFTSIVKRLAEVAG